MHKIRKLKLILNDCHKIEGDYVDFRVGSGSSFIHLVAAASIHGKTAYGFDTFCGLPQHTDKDLNSNRYFAHIKGMHRVDYTHASNFLQKNFNDKNYFLEKADIDTSINLLKDKKIAFALVDTLQYYPTKKVLDFLWENISYGGVIFVSKFEKHNLFSSDLALNEFIKNYGDNIVFNEQFTINGIKQDYLVIKVYNPKNRPLNFIPEKENKRNLSIALVLRTGGDVYDYNYVNAVANGIRKNTTMNPEIVCITDNSKGFNANIDRVVKFKHNFPRWWGKIELFRPDIFGDNRVFYVDLDTIFVKNIDNILNLESDFCGLRDFYHFDTLGSGVMSFIPEYNYKIYENFIKTPSIIMDNYTQGDQRWIDENKCQTMFYQDIFVNEIVSYKKHCLQPNKSIRIPENAKIICFHGLPRPHSIQDNMIKQFWTP